MRCRFPKPVIFSSRCLGFARCRWNGEILSDKLIEKLKPYVTFITVCPECEIGLGVPRDPIRIVSQQGSYRLIQPNTGKDLTEKMSAFVSGYLASLKAVDGFILKDRSPSCRPSGFFGRGILKRFPDAAVETEARLRDPTIREHFLTKVFTAAYKDLIQFKNGEG